MEVIQAPASAKHGSTVSKEVIRRTEARRVIERTDRKTRQRKFLVLAMPVEAGTCARRHCGIVQGRIKNCETITLAVIPGTEVRKTQAVVHSEAMRHLPAVLPKEVQLVVGLVVQHVLVGFLILSGKTRQQVGVGIAGAAADPSRLNEHAVAVVVARLLVDYIFVVAAKLHGVGAPDLRNGVAKRGEPLLGVQALAATFLETAGIKQRAHFASPPGDRWNLVYAVVKDARKRNIQRGAANLLGVFEDIRKVNIGVTEHKLVGERWVEDVQQADGE